MLSHKTILLDFLVHDLLMFNEHKFSMFSSDSKMFLWLFDCWLNSIARHWSDNKWKMRIAIIGSGVVGLTTALELQNEYRHARISIIADKFNKETTSYAAAGIFRPGTSFSGPTDEITRKWIYDAYQHWDEIRKSTEANIAGVCQVSGYIFSSISVSISRVIFLSYRHLS